jgi:hypothetical protein
MTISTQIGAYLKFEIILSVVSQTFAFQSEKRKKEISLKLHENKTFNEDNLTHAVTQQYRVYSPQS